MYNIYIKLFFSVLFWGSSAVVGKLLLDVLLPSQVIFLRFSIASIILGFSIFIIKKQSTKISFIEHIKLISLGSIGVSLCYYFYIKGLFYSSALNAGLIEATIPLVTLLIAVLIREEKFNLLDTLGFIVAYIGVVIIVTKLDLNLIKNSTYNIGDIYLLISTLCFGIYNILVKKLTFSKITQSQKLFYIFLYGSILLLPWLYIDSLSQKLNWNLSILNLVYVLILSLGASVLAYVFFNEGIEKIGASKASNFINLVPIITILFAVIFLKEIPDESQIIGMLTILTGIYISQNPNYMKKILYNIKKLLTNRCT